MIAQNKVENGNGAKKGSSYRTLTFLLGGIVGVAIVRYLILDPLEIIGWTIFWNALSEGRIMNLDSVFGSATFLKCAGGFIVGGFLGQFRIGGTGKQQGDSKEEKKEQ